MSSLQVKQCPEMFSFKAGNQRKLLGAKSRLNADGPMFPNQTFVASSESAVPYAVQHHHGGESHHC
jgi:hypothetical protein